MGVGDGQLSPALPSAFMSRSVTFRDKKPVYLLQIETFGTHGWGIAVQASLSLHPSFSPLTDMSAAILPRWVIMDKC